MSKANSTTFISPVSSSPRSLMDMVPIHLGKKLFIQKYGTEQDILKQVKERINNDS